MALVDCSGWSWYSSDSVDADALGAEQLQQRRLVLQLRAGRVAEASSGSRGSPASASCPCRGRPRRRSRARRGCACGRTRPAPRPSRPPGRAGRDSPGSGCRRTSRARCRRPAGPRSRPAGRSRRARRPCDVAEEVGDAHRRPRFGWRGKVKRATSRRAVLVEQDEVVALGRRTASSRRPPAAAGCPRCSPASSMRFSIGRSSCFAQPMNSSSDLPCLPEAPLELVEPALVEVRARAP